MTVTLYRAADNSTAYTGACFAIWLEDAKAYLSNPGFGGSTLHSLAVDIDSSQIAHIDSKSALVELLGGNVELDVNHAYEAVEDDTEVTEQISGWDGDEEGETFCVRERLQELGYVWCVYTDTYPEDCETWMYIGDDEFTMEAL